MKTPPNGPPGEPARLRQGPIKLGGAVVGTAAGVHFALTGRTGVPPITWIVIGCLALCVGVAIWWPFHRGDRPHGFIGIQRTPDGLTAFRFDLDRKRPGEAPDGNVGGEADVPVVQQLSLWDDHVTPVLMPSDLLEPRCSRCPVRPVNKRATPNSESWTTRYVGQRKAR